MKSNVSVTYLTKLAPPFSTKSERVKFCVNPLNLVVNFSKVEEKVIESEYIRSLFLIDCCESVNDILSDDWRDNPLSRSRLSVKLPNESEKVCISPLNPSIDSESVSDWDIVLILVVNFDIFSESVTDSLNKPIFIRSRTVSDIKLIISDMVLILLVNRERS